MNLENTLLKFKNFAATQILREINFGHFEALNTAILTISAAPNFEFLRKILTIPRVKFPKIKIQSLQNCQNGSF